MLTIVLLLASNIFMTIAWYGHLKYEKSPLWLAILVSWGIAFFEYCLQVPANRYGHAAGYSGFQLKITQEVITILVFIAFAWLYLKETPHWNHWVAFGLILGAVYFARLDGKNGAGKPEAEHPAAKPAAVEPSVKS